MKDNEGKCVLCGPQGLLALFGIALGVVFIFMSVDVLTNSALSSAIGRRAVEETVDDD